MFVDGINNQSEDNLLAGTTIFLQILREAMRRDLHPDTAGQGYCRNIPLGLAWYLEAIHLGLVSKAARRTFPPLIAPVSHYEKHRRSCDCG